jgi:hypothetical protein
LCLALILFQRGIERTYKLTDLYWVHGFQGKVLHLSKDEWREKDGRFIKCSLVFFSGMDGRIYIPGMFTGAGASQLR